MPTFLMTLHRWLATEPDGLAQDKRKTFMAVNYSMFLGTLCHLSFALIFFVLQEIELTLFNALFSIPLFSICIFEARKGNSTNAMTLATVELIAHAWIVSRTIGTDTAFFIYPLLLVALYPMMTWLSLGVRLSVSACPIAFTAFIYSNTRGLHNDSGLSTLTEDLMAGFNFLAFSTALAGIVTYYVWSHVNREVELTAAIAHHSQSSRAANDQLARITGLATFSQIAAHATSEQEVLDICGRVIYKITSTPHVDLILFDSNSGPFGTFFERVNLDPARGLVNLETIAEKDALRATIARDQNGRRVQSK